MEWEEEPRGIFPSLKWLDYSDGKKGLTVIHRGIPENEVRDRRGRLFNSAKKRVNAVLGWYFGSCNTCSGCKGVEQTIRVQIFCLPA